MQKKISNGKYFPCHLRLGSMFVMFNCFEISNRPLFGLVAMFMAFSCSFPMFYGCIYQLQSKTHFACKGVGFHFMALQNQTGKNAQCICVCMIIFHATKQWTVQFEFVWILVAYLREHVK